MSSRDPITFSFAHQDETERFAKAGLHVMEQVQERNTLPDVFTPEQIQKAILRNRFILACCAIGEPPLPTTDDMKQAEVMQEQRDIIRRSEQLTAEDYGIIVTASV